MEKLTLALMAGAQAIKNNNRLRCATHMYDIYGSQQKITYDEAMELLFEEFQRRLILEEPEFSNEDMTTAEILK